MKAKPVRDWELERYLLQELPSRRLQEIAVLLENDPELRKQLVDLIRSNAQILDLYPPKRLVSDIERKIQRKRHDAEKKKVGIFPKRWLYALPVLASAFFLVFIVLQDRNAPFSQDPEEGFHQGIRIKGEEDIDMSQPQIIIYRKLGEQAEIVKDGDSATQGDLLQIAYVPAGMKYGVIFSIDGNGVVTLHHPDHAEGSSDLIPEKKILLDSAYELDDAPQFERFFLVASSERLDVAGILKLAENMADSPDSVRTDELSLPETFTQFSILLNKEKHDES